MRYLTVKQVADRLGISAQSARSKFPVVKIGRSVRIAEGVLRSIEIRQVLAADPGLAEAVEDYRLAEMILEHLDPDPDARADPETAALMMSAVAAWRIEHGHRDMVGIDGVHPRALRFLKRNAPLDGGGKGERLRTMIRGAL